VSDNRPLSEAACQVIADHIIRDGHITAVEALQRAEAAARLLEVEVE